MSSTTGRSNLSLSLRGPSVNFFGPNDLFLERNWNRPLNYVIEEHDLTPTQTGTFTPGTDTTIECDKRGDLGGHEELVWTRAVFATSTNARACDWEAPFSVDYVEYTYGNKQLHKVFGE